MANARSAEGSWCVERRGGGVSEVGGGAGLQGQREPGSSPLRAQAKAPEEEQACAPPASELPRAGARLGGLRLALHLRAGVKEERCRWPAGRGGEFSPAPEKHSQTERLRSCSSGFPLGDDVASFLCAEF